MVLEPAVTELHELYIGHVLGCRACYAPTRRYCAAGGALRLDYTAYYLLTLDLNTRRSVIAHEERQDAIWCDELKQKLIELHALKKLENVDF